MAKGNQTLGGAKAKQPLCTRYRQSYLSAVDTCGRKRLLHCDIPSVQYDHNNNRAWVIPSQHLGNSCLLHLMLRESASYAIQYADAIQQKIVPPLGLYIRCDLLPTVLCSFMYGECYVQILTSFRPGGWRPAHLPAHRSALAGAIFTVLRLVVLQAATTLPHPRCQGTEPVPEAASAAPSPF